MLVIDKLSTSFPNGNKRSSLYVQYSMGYQSYNGLPLVHKAGASCYSIYAGFCHISVKQEDLELLEVGLSLS